jgi:adenylate cyclase
MARAFEAGAPAHNAEWQEVVTHGHSVKSLRRLKRIMRLLPGSPRCKVCYNPFGGFGGSICRLIGFTPSKKNPQLCSLCCEKLPRGGAEVETAILFADIRDSTSLAERMGPAAYAELLNRFYGVATEMLIAHDATVDKLIGDEVMAFFIPGFSGPDFKAKAVDAGRSLMRAFGYGGTEPPWLPVGIGIDVGPAFVGNIGGKQIVDFTALGDPVNTAQRIQAKAKPGELLVSELAFSAVAERFPDLPRSTTKLRGKSAQIGVYSLPI